MSAPAAIRLAGVSRHFGTVRALDNVTFEVADGEFFALLGPSGSGKTTCLRLIAGFEQPDAGTIEIHGASVAGVPPYERDVNTVFQDYALFPHMSVAENVEYGPMVRGVDKSERRRRAREMLALVKLEGLEERRPAQLSGGQRQRVALARALINRPRVLLLDEPLGALDLKMREQMQVELKSLQRTVGITFIFVTHDQGEALAMSDRLAVFNHGRIEQIGAPQALYNQPASVFVAGFIGVSNIFDGETARRLAGSAAPFTIRPERVRLLKNGEAVADDAVVQAGRIAASVYLGATTRYIVRLDGGGEIAVQVQNTDEAAAAPALDQSVRVVWQKRHQLPLAGSLDTSGGPA
ncbi:MAG TPA: ABC transporter ATP-binding protein [Burkholderiaceae bacterium]|nr:ABC transporter ATP-binding protein [Burkholderiaceae bacterium]